MKLKYPKARSAGFPLLVFLATTLPGCCTCKERYDPFLRQVHENLVTDIRPKYEKALRASGRADDLVANDLALVDDTAASIARVISGSGPAEEKGGAE